MALKATIYKATVNVADLDRNQFLDASLTLARHPSETQERMMLRLLAWKFDITRCREGDIRRFDIARPPDSDNQRDDKSGNNGL